MAASHPSSSRTASSRKRTFGSVDGAVAVAPPDPEEDPEDRALQRSGSLEAATSSSSSSSRDWNSRLSELEATSSR